MSGYRCEGINYREKVPASRNREKFKICEETESRERWGYISVNTSLSPK